MDKTAVIFISHIYNQYTYMRYRQLKASLIADQELFWIHTNGDYGDFFERYKDVDHIYVGLRDDYFDKHTSNMPNNSYLFADIYEMLSDYAYYWFVEYDVCVNSVLPAPYKIIFEHYVYGNRYEKDADIIADHINSYNTNHSYNIVYNFNSLRRKYLNIDELNLQYNDIHFGFYPFCRLSNRLLKILHDDPRWQTFFFEWGITTCAYKHNMKICTLLNTWTCENQQVPRIAGMKINNGSNSFRPKPYKEYYPEYPRNYIIHAVKDYA